MDETEAINVVDNLTTRDATAALSAKQGVVLREMIEQITTPETATDEDIDAIFAESTTEA